MDRPAQWPGAQHRVVPLLRQQGLGGRRQLESHVLVLELGVHPGQHQIDDLDDLGLGQLVEDDDVVDPVEELGPEVLLELVLNLRLHPLVVDGALTGGEPDAGALGDVPGAQVRRHDQNGVLEVDQPALGVGQPTVLQDLQEGVEDVGVRLLDLVEQDHRERLAPHPLGELAALLVADVAGRGTHQPRDGVLLHVLGHVELDERVLVTEEELGERLGQLRLTDTGRAGEDERTAGALGVLQPGTGAPDRLGDSLDGLLLADDALV